MSPQSLELAAVSATSLAARVMACPLAFPAADMACGRPRLGKFSQKKELDPSASRPLRGAETLCAERGCHEFGARCQRPFNYGTPLVQIRHTDRITFQAKRGFSLSG